MVESDTIEPHSAKALSTGIALRFGYSARSRVYARIVGRSSIGLKGLHVHEGAVDSENNGEQITFLLCAHLENLTLLVIDSVTYSRRNSAPSGEPVRPSETGGKRRTIGPVHSHTVGRI